MQHFNEVTIIKMNPLKLLMQALQAQKQNAV